MEQRLIMSNLEPMALSTLPCAKRSKVSAGSLSLLALLGSMLLAGGCTDTSDDPGGGLVDAGGPDAALPDAGVSDDASGAAETVYFLVAEPPGMEMHNDSYVLPLTDADHIEHARALIAEGPDSAGLPIVVAGMRAGADGINRDLRAEGAPAWSWHITEIITFADNSMEVLDGWPSYVEMDVAGWIENTSDEDATEGRVGFWSYTVVDELVDYPMSLP